MCAKYKNCICISQTMKTFVIEWMIKLCTCTASTREADKIPFLLSSSCSSCSSSRINYPIYGDIAYRGTLLQSDSLVFLLLFHFYYASARFFAENSGKHVFLISACLYIRDKTPCHSLQSASRSRFCQSRKFHGTHLPAFASYFFL